MTRSEQLYLDRLRAIRTPASVMQPKKEDGILGNLLGGMLGGPGGAVNLLADQGPLPDGGNLGQPGLTPTYTGGEGTPVLALGNPDREQIKIGPFFKPRVDQEAAARLAQDPLAPVQLEKPTTGIGGFFRRMLGDNANERNAALAQQQRQLKLQKWLIDQQTQGRLSVAEQQHKYELERLKAASDLNNAETQYRMQLGLQGKQLENTWALQQQAQAAKQARTDKFDELTGIVGDPIKAAMLQEQMLRAPLDKLAADAAEANARAQGTGGFAPRPAQGTGAPTGFKAITDTLIQDNETGNLFNYDPATGTMTPVGQAGSGEFDTVAASARARELTAAKAAQNKIENLQKPGTVLGGIGTVASDIGNTIRNSGAKVAPYVPGLSVLKAIGDEKDLLFGHLRRLDEQKKARELMKLGLVNPIPTTE